jgi:uncharacterized protein YgiM (DUF1202 family)
MTMKLGLSSDTPTPVASPSATPTPTPKTATSAATINPDPAKPFLVVKDTPTGFLRVRMDPGTSATEAARINPGDKFTIVETQTVSDTNWYEIKYDGTNVGWVSGQYVTTVE